MWNGDKLYTNIQSITDIKPITYENASIRPPKPRLANTDISVLAVIATANPTNEMNPINTSAVILCYLSAIFQMLGQALHDQMRRDAFLVLRYWRLDTSVVRFLDPLSVATLVRH